VPQPNDPRQHCLRHRRSRHGPSPTPQAPGEPLPEPSLSRKDMPTSQPAVGGGFARQLPPVVGADVLAGGMVTTDLRCLLFGASLSHCYQCHRLPRRCRWPRRQLSRPGFCSLPGTGDFVRCPLRVTAAAGLSVPVGGSLWRLPRLLFCTFPVCPK
jgi:hypothetical protein